MNTEYENFETQQYALFQERVNQQFNIDRITRNAGGQCLNYFFSVNNPYLEEIKAVNRNQNLSQMEKFGAVVEIYKQLKQKDSSPQVNYWLKRIASEFQHIGDGITATVVLSIEKFAIQQFHEKIKPLSETESTELSLSN